MKKKKNKKYSPHIFIIFIIALFGVFFNSYLFVKTESIKKTYNPIIFFVDGYKSIKQKIFGEKEEPLDTIWVVATAYSSTVWQTDSTPCLTYTEFDVCDFYDKYGRFDTIAANGIEIGTKVRIPELYGDKVFVVRDRMSKRYGYGRIDIWLPVYEDAKNFGAKRVQMEIYE